MQHLYWQFYWFQCTSYGRVREWQRLILPRNQRLVIRKGFLVFLRFLSSMVTQRLRLALCALVFCCVDIAQAATVKTLRVWRADDYTRIVLDLDAPVHYNLVLANNPTRIILDVAGTTMKASLTKLPLAKTPIEIVRSSIVNDTDLRLVFDLKNKVSPKSFLLKKSNGNNDRLVIDLFDATSTVSTNNRSANNSATANSEPANIEALMRNDTNSVATKPNVDAASPGPSTITGRQILIAVDAGHGGADSGALGPKGMREKDVTLAIAKELTRVINAQPGYSANLTRTGDYFVELQKRRDLARDMKADLFISVHADSFTDSSAYGASVFALSRKGATSEMARFLAQRENDSDLIGRVGGVSLEDKDPQLAGVLVDLSMTSTVNSSLQVGSNVLNAISAITPLHAKHVEQAGFVVLKSPDVPSILVETGFISNASESKKLASPDYREQMAQAIFKGVRQYFAQHPPANTHAVSANVTNEKAPAVKSSSAQEVLEKPGKKKTVADNNPSGERKHLVISGDTLTDIAAQYKVSAAKIRKANNMKNDVVKLGQTLKIPAQP
jgi:N-acetylmuramoyl-L-alanine amidase